MKVLMQESYALSWLKARGELVDLFSMPDPIRTRPETSDNSGSDQERVESGLPWAADGGIGKIHFGRTQDLLGPDLIFTKPETRTILKPDPIPTRPH